MTRRRERRVRPHGRGRQGPRAGAPRGGGADAGRARRLCRSPAGAALRRTAAARGARALPRHRAVARAPRRAARQSRRQSPRVDGGRVRALSRAHRHDDDLRHARSGRGDGARRSHRGDGQRAGCCRSRRRRSSIASPRTKPSPASSARAWCCRSRCVSVDGGRHCVAPTSAATACACAARRRRRRRDGARACVRARDLRIVAPTSPGVDGADRSRDLPGRSLSARGARRGGAGAHLHLTVPEPSALRPGETIRLDVADGWVIPAARRN